MKKILIGLILLGIAGFGIWWYITDIRKEKAGNTNTNTNSQVWNNRYDLIRPDNIQPNDRVGSPLRLSGQARGTWFFEASFPIRLLDATGKELGVGIAQAKSEWMTEDFVPFETVITFDIPATETGFVVFQKDNPSGLPEYDDELRIPVLFAETNAASTQPKDGIVNAECFVGGCSGEICADEKLVSPCLYLPEFACYQTAKCERQANDECGWTQTAELTECLAAKAEPIQE